MYHTMEARRVALQDEVGGEWYEATDDNPRPGREGEEEGEVVVVRW